MVGDLLLKFSDKQTFASGVSQNIVDLGDGENEFRQPALPNIGRAYPVVKVFVAEADATGLTDFQVDVEYSADEAFTAPITLQSLYRDPAGSLAVGTTLVAGAVDPRDYRYMRLNYTVTGTVSGATITAGIYTSL